MASTLKSVMDPWAQTRARQRPDLIFAPKASIIARLRAALGLPWMKKSNPRDQGELCVVEGRCGVFVSSTGACEWGMWRFRGEPAVRLGAFRLKLLMAMVVLGISETDEG